MKSILKLCITAALATAEEKSILDDLQFVATDSQID